MAVGDSEAFLWIQSVDYQCEQGALGTCFGLPVLGLNSSIQQQRLVGSVPEPQEITASGG